MLAETEPKIRKISEVSELLAEAEKIRMSSFVSGDLVLLERLQHLEEAGYGEYSILVDKEKEKTESVMGIMYRCFYPKVTYILYIAIREDKRSKGLGAKWLKKLGETSLVPLMLDIESVREKAEDHDMRVRRRDFYLRNGFKDSGYVLKEDDDIYDILTTDGRVYAEEFADAMKKLGFARFHGIVMRAEEAFER